MFCERGGRRRPGHRAALLLILLLAVTTGCGAEDLPAAATPATPEAMPAPAPQAESAEAMPGRAASAPAQPESFGGKTAREALSSRKKFPTAAANMPTQPSTGNRPAQSAGDAQRAPLLIYTATLTVAVFQTERALDRIESAARQAGGYLVQRSDRSITVRVPARRFRAALASIVQVGDVLHRNVSVEDVTQRYTDLRLRLKNAEAVRDRLVKLLNKAQAVKDALQVERELARVTDQIELLKGKLKVMRELIAYSTITVTFQPQPTEHVGPHVKLPFPWLDQLGLKPLLSL